MKKIIAISILAALLTGCGRPMTSNGIEYPTYGLFNENTSKSNNVCYEVSIGNVVWSIIGIENIIMPVYFIGFSIYNPIGFKSETGECSPDKIILPTN